MINCDDYFGGLSEEEYVREMKEHFKALEEMSLINYDRAMILLNSYKENLFNNRLPDDDRKILYFTIRNLLDWYEEEYGSEIGDNNE